jgi:hypothetical protein
MPCCCLDGCTYVDCPYSTYELLITPGAPFLTLPAILLYSSCVMVIELSRCFCFLR